MGDEKESSSSTVVLAFLTGAAIGALAALVLAPQSGEDTQRQLRGYARKVKKELHNVSGKAEDTWEDVLEQGRELFKGKKPLVNEAFKAGRKVLRQGRDRFMGKKKK